MNLDEWCKVAQIAGYVVGGASLGFTARTYWRNNKIKQGEWLKTLFEKFYEEQKFKEVRRESNMKH